MSYDVNSKNAVTLIGNVGHDLEVREHNKRKVVNLRVCTNEGYTPEEGERVEKEVWHSVVAWGPHAERLIKGGVKKGSKVFIEGRLGYSPAEKEIDGVIHHFQNPVIEVLNSINLSPKPAEAPAEAA